MKIKSNFFLCNGLRPVTLLVSRKRRKCRFVAIQPSSSLCAEKIEPICPAERLGRQSRARSSKMFTLFWGRKEKKKNFPSLNWLQKHYNRTCQLTHYRFVEFGEFILGTDKGVETADGCHHKLRSRLIERCDHLSDEVNVQCQGAVPPERKASATGRHKQLEAVVGCWKCLHCKWDKKRQASACRFAQHNTALLQIAGEASCVRFSQRIAQAFF